MDYDAVAERERNPVSKHQPIRFGFGVENERTDAGRNGQTCLARTNSQARPLATSRIGNHTGRFVLCFK